MRLGLTFLAGAAVMTLLTMTLPSVAADKPAAANKPGAANKPMPPFFETPTRQKIQAAPARPEALNLTVPLSPTQIALKDTARTKMIEGAKARIKLTPVVPGTLKPVGTLTPSRPTKKALIVVLENGGIVKNLGQFHLELPKLRVATCKSFNFELKAGQNIGDLVGDLSAASFSSLECLNPFEIQKNWTIMTLADFVDKESDRMLENGVKGTTSLLRAQARYNQVVVLEDGTATPAALIQKIGELARDHLIDIHILTHGGNNHFVGATNFTSASFFEPLKARMVSGEIPLYLRAVYQMNCLGGTLRDEWLSLGVDVVNGTEGSKLNYMPWQYLEFLKEWLGGATFAVSNQRAYDRSALVSDLVYTLVGHPGFAEDSRLPLTGNGSIRVTD